MSWIRRTRRSQRAQTGIPLPEGLRVAWLDADSEPYAVLSYPMARWSVPDSMTPAETEVVLAVLRGSSRSEIAAARKASIHTIHNQLAGAFRKLGVRSRGELAALLAGRGRKQD